MKPRETAACLLLALALPRMAAARPADDVVALDVRDGRPLVEGVYVNGHGPYRFLLDTGATLNQIEPKLARSIGMPASFETRLTSSNGVTMVKGSEGHVVKLGPVAADGQIFLYSAMDAIRQLAPGIQGVLGQAFLSRFDYLLDVRAGRMEFGTPELHGKGMRASFQLVQGRPAVATSLGLLVLDSGTHLLVRFGIEAIETTHKMSTVSGTTPVGTVRSVLVIDGRTFWRGDAVALGQPAETGAAGLLPISVFKTVFVCNSGGYVVLD